MRITSTLVSKKQFSTIIRGHDIRVDLPADLGGDDAGPMPPELFVTALGTCVGVYAVNYCQKHQISTDGLTVYTDWEKGTDPARITRMSVAIDLPAGVPKEKYEAFMRTVEQCLIHNTLCRIPLIEIELVNSDGDGKHVVEAGECVETQAE